MPNITNKLLSQIIVDRLIDIKNRLYIYFIA